jgi:hypothetical protein
VHFQEVAVELRVPLRKTLEHLLQNQYVRNDLDGSLYAVALGSGQGQVASGDISDVTFYRLVEDGLVSDSILAQHGIEMYARYRDDIIILARQANSVRQFVALMKGRAKALYNIKCESVSSHSCDFLDFTIYKGREFRKGSLSIRPYHKPTSQHIPLSSESCHNMSVHMSWPRAEVSRWAHRSSTYEEFEQYKLARLSTWKKLHMHESSINSLHDIAYHEAIAPHGRRANRDNVFWIVLPHDPNLQLGKVNAELQAICSAWKSIIDSVLGRSTSFRICLKNCLPNMITRISRPKQHMP